MTIHELERQLATMFKGAGFETPGFEARQLLLAALNLEMGDLLSAEEMGVAPQLVQKIQDWMNQRIAGVPLAYLTGKKGFYKHDFLVMPGVLVPRPETEHVLEVALARVLEQRLTVRNFADLGSGSGCLGLSLLAELPSAKLFAIDSSDIAYENTRRNAKALKLDARFASVHAPVESWKATVRFELVVANPPYIALGDTNVQPSVHEHEPHTALYSGADGLTAIRAWARWAREALQPGGVFVCEIGSGQTQAVKDIIEGLGFQKTRVTKDLAGHDRVVSALNKR
jgi:release factor glutamine methyltransferase